MFRQLSRRFYSFYSQAKPQVPLPSVRRNLHRAGGLLALPAFYYLGNSIYCSQREERSEPLAPPAPAASPCLIENPRTVWEKVKSGVLHAARFFQLVLIFLPSILTFPLRFFKATEKLWLSIFVSSVERAGVVWIKAFQYLSHRRDVLGPEMAESFTHLRENAPQHSFEETRRNFKKAFGKEIEEVFEEF